MASRTLVLACALPLLALLLASQCLHATAGTDSLATSLGSSGLSATSGADVVEFDRLLEPQEESSRRILKKKKDKKKDKKSKKSSDAAAPAPAPEPEPATTGGKSATSKKGKKGSPPPPTTTTTPTKKGGKAGNVTKPLVRKPVSSKDKTVIADLESAATSVDDALSTLKTATYTKSLTDTATALRNCVILINQGYQRELVPQQIANAVATIDGVSVMLNKGKESKTIASLASAKADALAAQKGYTV
jgi:hypothetical protein